MVAFARQYDFDQMWTLDGSSNFGTFDDDGASQTRTANEANEIETITGGWITPTYDAAGNMISGPKPGSETVRVHYVYDAWNRLAAMNANDGSPLAEFRYDGLNRRIEKLGQFGQDGWTEGHHYYYNQNGQILEDREVNDVDVPQSIDQYAWNPSYVDSPMVCLHDGDADGDVEDGHWTDWRRYYLTDANHNVTTMIRFGKDGFGADYIADVTRNVYTAYGEVAQHDEDWTGTGIESNFDGPLYCGYFFDADTGLYQVRNRYYDPGISTFVNRDPIASSPNPYAYCGDRPTGATDPTGLGDSMSMLAEMDSVNANPALSASEKNFQCYQIARKYDNRGMVQIYYGLVTMQPGQTNIGTGPSGVPGYVCRAVDFLNESAHALANQKLISEHSRLRSCSSLEASVLGQRFLGSETPYGGFDPNLVRNRWQEDLLGQTSIIVLLEAGGILAGEGLSAAKRVASSEAWVGSVEGGSYGGLRAPSTFTPKVTPKGITRVEQHLSQFGNDAANQAMIARLKTGQTMTQDINFYMHELKESAVMGRTEGVFSDVFEWQRAAHLETLKWQKIPYAPGYESQLYHPEVIRQFPQQFNPVAWPK